MTETQTIKRAHQWTPARAGVKSVCQRCGMVKAKATTIHCYEEEVTKEDG